jgi:hypothetical protein
MRSIARVTLAEECRVTSTGTPIHATSSRKTASSWEHLEARRRRKTRPQSAERAIGPTEPRPAAAEAAAAA